jgi:Polyketide cyclase / dehydrase and lipid transport
MIIPIVTALAVVAAFSVILVARRPDAFRIARSILTIAPPEVAFAQVNDLHRWQEISPYAKYDSAAEYAFSGPNSGTGATLAWAGNNKIGEGRMTIIASRPYEFVRMNLKFFKPFKASHTAEFTFESEGEQTKVTWSMFGRSRFMCKAMGLFMNMDKMIGSQFEEGLANLKAIAEAQIENLQAVH